MPITVSGNAHVKTNLIITVSVAANLFRPTISALLFMGYDAQVIVVHADPVAADMVEFHAFWNLANEHSPRGPVSTYDFIAKSDLAVPVFVNSTRPIPASSIPIKLDLGKQAFKQCFKFTGHRLLHSILFIAFNNKLFEFLHFLLGSVFTFWGIYLEEHSDSVCVVTIGHRLKVHFHELANITHKKAADLDSLNWPYAMAKSRNRLLNQLFAYYSQAVQSLSSMLPNPQPGVNLNYG